LIDVSVPETPGGYVDSETISGISTGLSPGNHLSHIRTDGWPGFNTGESQRAFRLRTPAGGPRLFPRRQQRRFQHRHHLRRQRRPMQRRQACRPLHRGYAG
jgi:hypothetical protein